MINKSFRYVCFVFISFIFSCRSDKPNDEVQPSITITPNGGVFIVNEGLFNAGNGAVGYYNNVDNTYINDLFEPINKRPLGDVFQSMTIFNHKAYLVVNNSGKIEVVNPESFVSVGTINGLTSPRNFLPVSNGKAYVSNYKTNVIQVVDLNTNIVTGGIPCGTRDLNEEMVLSYGKAYVTTPSSDKVYVIDTRKDVCEDSIQVSRGASSIREDINGKLWVLCSGKKSTNELASLCRINPLTNKVETSFTFADNTYSPWRLNINGELTALFFISKDGIYKMNITDTALPTAPLIPRGGKDLYGLGVDPKNGTIYSGDAVNFSGEGVVYRYQSNGTFINSFKTGIGPNNFCFN
jgi:DNA-binding beta-propeller fold protein YncE